MVGHVMSGVHVERGGGSEVTAVVRKLNVFFGFLRDVGY
jgi:molybdopterin-binding protein